MQLRLSIILALTSVTLCSAAFADPPAAQTVRGVVYEDRDRNGARGPDEPGLPGVRVSNGRDVIVTDKDGAYQLPIGESDVIFVIKPRNYLTKIDGQNLPRFYYVHQPAGSPPGLKYAGVAPTGPLPASVDFPLIRKDEPDKFDVVVFGDPQPRDATEVNYLAQDLLPELIGMDAAFGLSLGDIVYDRLNLYGPSNAVMSTVGIPWYNVPGNHDENYDVPDDELANETWKRVFGPPTYSFDYGPVHFIVLDNVVLHGQKEEGRYHSEVGRHLTFIQNDLKHVPNDKLVVLMMHIPIVETKDRERFFALLKDRPHTFSLSAHWHFQKHYFLGEQDGWFGRQPHHHLVHATACGSWWAGAPDEFGIPHTLMRDGAPNGYSIITFDGNAYRIRFQAARRPAADQMSIFAPSVAKAAEMESVEVLANVYAGSERNTVELRINGGTWKKMERVEQIDPFYAAIQTAEKGENPPNGRRLPNDPVPVPHLWSARLGARLPPGGYVIEVRSRDMFDQTAIGRRLLQVE